jgi:hypothetical protein
LRQPCRNKAKHPDYSNFDSSNHPDHHLETDR